MRKLKEILYTTFEVAYIIIGSTLMCGLFMMAIVLARDVVVFLLKGIIYLLGGD